MTTPFARFKQSLQNSSFDTEKLVGKVILSDEEETTLAAEEYIRKKDLPKPHRVLGPNSFATMDHRPERLNIKVNADMKILGTHYG